MKRRIGFAITVSVLISGCVASAPGIGLEDDTPSFTDQVHAMPVMSKDAHDDSTHAVIYSAPAGAHLTYYGGKVVQHASVVEVLYGSGTYISQLTATGAGSMR